MLTINMRRSAATPQSFNRYAYVQNDPVNFTDPSGLLRWAGPEKRGPYNPDYWGADLGGDFGWLYDAIGSGGEDIGGGTAEPEPPNTQQDDNLLGRTNWNSCQDFVNYLVELATNLQIPSTRSTRISGIRTAAMTLGGAMSFGARLQHGEYINNRFDGFRQELVANGQGAGVYGHVLGNAGTYLWGGITGAGARAFNAVIDGVQRTFGTPERSREAEAEVAGNVAGVRVGRHIWNYLNSPRNAEHAGRLGNSLRSELCQ